MGQPKALLRYEGEAFLERLHRLFQGVCAEVHVVTGAHDALLRQALPDLAPRMTWNPRHEEGQFTSLRHGLDQCSAGLPVLFTPVDFGGVAPSTIAALLPHAGAPLVKPTYNGKSGHPVLLGAAAREALGAAPLSANAREILSHVAAMKIAVRDAACVLDVDTPEDYQRLLAGSR